MKTGRLSTILLVAGVALTLINLGLMAYLIFRSGTLTAREVIQGRRIELVDDQGRVRAQLLITQPVTVEGKFYAESVLFRLIDPNGRPGVKLGTSVDGSGMSLAGDSEKRDWSGVQLLADGSSSSVVLTNKDGRIERLAP